MRWGAVCLLILFCWSLERAFHTLKTSAEMPPDGAVANEVLYLPSPVERAFLEADPELWPKLFRPERPLEAENIPEFYSAARGSRAVGMLDGTQLEAARRWSVLLNGLHLDALRAQLPQVPDPAQILARRSQQSCTLLEQEALYRWTQIRPNLKSDFISYLRTCDPNGILADWLRLDVAIANKDRDAVAEATQKLHLKSVNPDQKPWDIWFATQATKVGEGALQALVK